MMIRFIILTTLIFIPGLAAATGQAPDKMAYEGAVYRVHGFQLAGQMKAKLDHYHMTSKCAVANSANWDGFYAELSLRDKKLYLVNLSTDWDKRPSMNCRAPTVDEVFGVTLPADGLFAEWFDGRLFNGYGDCSNFSCPHYRLFYFKSGILTKVEERDREDFLKIRLQEKQSNE